MSIFSSTFSAKCQKFVAKKNRKKKFQKEKLDTTNEFHFPACTDPPGTQQQIAHDPLPMPSVLGDSLIPVLS